MIRWNSAAIATTPIDTIRERLSSNADSIMSELGQVEQEEGGSYAGHCSGLDLDIED